MAKKFVKATTSKWQTMSDTEKSNYNDSIIFVQNDNNYQYNPLGDSYSKGNYILQNGIVFGGGIDMNTIISHGSIDKYNNSGSLGLDIEGYNSASIGTVPSKTSNGISWVELPSNSGEGISASETNIIYDSGNLDLNGGLLKQGDKTIIDSSGDLIQASSTQTGGIKVSSVNTSTVAVNSESTTSGRYYPVELNSDGKAIVNVPWTDNNTKNTAGSTNSSLKLFLIGATSQAANPQTYSHDTAYVGTDGCLYSSNSKVLIYNTLPLNELQVINGRASTHAIPYAYTSSTNVVNTSSPFSIYYMQAIESGGIVLNITPYRGYSLNNNLISQNAFCPYNIRIYLDSISTENVYELAVTYTSNITDFIYIIKVIDINSGSVNQFRNAQLFGGTALNSILDINLIVDEQSTALICTQTVYR